MVWHKTIGSGPTRIVVIHGWFWDHRVFTPMLDGVVGLIGEHLKATALSPEAVADSVIDGLAEERFLILPHPQVAEYFQHRANDNDRWLRGMRRLQDQMRVAQ